MHYHTFHTHSFTHLFTTHQHTLINTITTQHHYFTIFIHCHTYEHSSLLYPSIVYMFFIHCHSLSLHNTSTHSHTQSNTTTYSYLTTTSIYLLTFHTHTHHNKTTLLSSSIVLFGHHSFINALSFNSYTFIHSPTHNTFINTTHHKHKHPYFT